MGFVKSWLLLADEQCIYFDDFLSKVYVNQWRVDICGLAVAALTEMFGWGLVWRVAAAENVEYSSVYICTTEKVPQYVHSSMARSGTTYTPKGNLYLFLGHIGLLYTQQSKITTQVHFFFFFWAFQGL